MEPELLFYRAINLGMHSDVQQFVWRQSALSTRYDQISSRPIVLLRYLLPEQLFFLPLFICEI